MTTNTTVPQPVKQNVSGPSLANLIPFEQICEPGAYVCTWNGQLLRVPAEGINHGGCPCMYIVGTEPLFVTKITCDPFVPLSKARMLACNFDIDVNF